MTDDAKDTEIGDKIWAGDLLGRRREAEIIQSFIEHESATYIEQNRAQSLVLAIDAKYGEGKSWFLDRLAEQLSLSHPVARIDAWADDASEEPLTAFMSSIDDALAPYCSKSDKMRDKVAAAKIAAFPVMGRLVKGVMIKGLTKIAGDGADEALADVFDGALEGARELNKKEGDGAAAAMVEGAMEEFDKAIDSVVDRRGAAMLAEYRQRRRSREGFRSNMRELVRGIDESSNTTSTPLVVIIDELDRCRPDYAIRVLEEIKHFFDVPGVVFILAIHRDQLIESVKAIYGPSFNSEEYLRRFFDRRWLLRRLTTAEIVATHWQSWGGLTRIFSSENLIIGEAVQEVSAERILSRFFDLNELTAREAFAVLDALRLFAQTWNYSVPISTLIAAPMAINLVRQKSVNDFSQQPAYDFGLQSYEPIDDFSRRPATASVKRSIEQIISMSDQPIMNHMERNDFRDANRYFASILFSRELELRQSSNKKPDRSSKSLISEYADRFERIEGLIERPAAQ